MFICSLRVDISIVVLCYASDVTEYDKRRAELSNAPLHKKQDTTSIEEFKVLRLDLPGYSNRVLHQ